MEQQNNAQITVAFSYPITTYDGMEASPDLVQAAVTDQLHKLCDEVMKTFHCQIHISPPESGFTQTGLHEFNFALLVVGSPNQVIDAKGSLLRRNPSQSIANIKVNKLFVINQNGEMKASIRKKFDEIMAQTKTQITCAGQFDGKVKPPPGLAPDRMDVEIMGRLDAVEHARLRCLVALDTQSGLHSESLNIDVRLLPIISGRKRAIINSIMQETLTNIYMPSVFRSESLAVPQLEDPSWDMDVNHRVTVFITGSHSGVLAAKEKLINLIITKKSMLASRTVICLSRKLDWILVNRKEKIISTMVDNSTLVVMPPLGTNTNMLTVVGDDRVYIERTIRAIMLLICNFYVSCIQRPSGAPLISSILNQQHQQKYPPMYPPFNSGMDQSSALHINAYVQQLCRSTRAEIILQPQYIEICGYESSVKAAFEQIISTDFLKNSRDSKFQLELALEHREFINGKKNGKINKIIKISGCKINFQENFNGYNMLIEIQNSSAPHALEGLTLLEDEMPAEISFFVPEAYHKRIIGVGGKNIQRIMKKYGVYVKFSNAEEFASLGGYFENIDNVIARTPAKNSENLDQLKESITELITTKDKRDVNVIAKIPREHHRTVLGIKGMNVQRIEAMASVQITFPSKELGSEDVVINGPETQCQHAKQLLKELIPEVNEIQIPASSKAKALVDSMEFNQEIIIKLKKEFLVDLYVFIPPVAQNLSKPPSSSDTGGYTVLLNSEGVPINISLMLHFYPSSQLEQARALVVSFLNSKEISLDFDKSISRAGSYANVKTVPRTTASYDSFQHFNSKLLAPVTTAESPTTPATVNPTAYSLFNNDGGFDLSGGGGGGGGGGSGRTPKVAHSAPNLRLLFEDVFPAPNAPIATSAAGGPSSSSAKLNAAGYDGPTATGYPKTRSTVYDDDADAVDSLDLLGATLAATSLTGYHQPSAVGNTGPTHRNLLGSSDKRREQQFGQQQLFGMGESSEIASGPSNIWSNMGRMGSEGINSSESDSDGSQRQQQLKVPNDKFRGLALSKSLSETMEDKKIKRPQPVSKLQRQIDSDSDASENSRFFNESSDQQQQQQQQQQSTSKAWGVVVPSMNPLAPSFQPGMFQPQGAQQQQRQQHQLQQKQTSPGYKKSSTSNNGHQSGK